MGHPMAALLAGWPAGLVVYDTRPEVMKPLAEAGALQASSAAEVAAAAGIISVMVRDDDQVREVVRALASASAVPEDTTRAPRTSPATILARFR